MRIAAGVLLIIVAVGNLAGGLLYAGAGGLMGFAGSAAEEGVKFEVTDTETGETETVDLETEEGAKELKEMGGLVLLWGLFLLVLTGLCIAAAVMLFTEKNPVFVMVTAVLELLADIGTIVVAKTVIWSTFGIVAAVLALLAAKSMGRTPASG